MTDELNLDRIEQDIENKNNITRRMQSLVEAKKRSESERDKALKVKQSLEDEKKVLAKERDFYSSFSDSLGKYPDAKDFKDKIKEKVLQGYDVEDATVSVLAKEGKLNQTAPVAERETVAGGSAPTQLKTGGQKPISDMSQAERRAALMEAESKGELVA
jgi:hypothetical protein